MHAIKNIGIEQFSNNFYIIIFSGQFNIENEDCMVIIMSTTGDGNPPANAEKFMRRLKNRTLNKDYLIHLGYALLGE